MADFPVEGHNYAPVEMYIYTVFNSTLLYALMYLYLLTAGLFGRKQIH